MFSGKCKIALKAAIALARFQLKEGRKKKILILDLSVETGLTRPYLAKIIGDMTKGGICESFKGPRGGVRLSKASKDISLEDVFESVERFGSERKCVLEDKLCKDVESCPLHKTCKIIHEKILKKTSLYKIIQSLGEK